MGEGGKVTGRETAENANVALSLKKVNLELQNSFTGIQLICSRCGTVVNRARILREMLMYTCSLKKLNLV